MGVHRAAMARRIEGSENKEGRACLRVSIPGSDRRPKVQVPTLCNIRPTGASPDSSVALFFTSRWSILRSCEVRLGVTFRAVSVQVRRSQFSPSELLHVSPSLECSNLSRNTSEPFGQFEYILFTVVEALSYLEFLQVREIAMLFLQIDFPLHALLPH